MITPKYKSAKGVTVHDQHPEFESFEVICKNTSVVFVSYLREYMLTLDPFTMVKEKEGFERIYARKGEKVTLPHSKYRMHTRDDTNPILIYPNPLKL